MRKTFIKPRLCFFLLFGALVFGMDARAQVNMANGSVTVCSGMFYDSGGPGASYGNDENLIYTIYPQAGNVLQVSFAGFFEVEECCDSLRIYNGNSMSSPLLGTYTSNPGTLTSSAPDGSLTFQFTSDGSAVGEGWVAALSCVSGIACTGAPAPGAATPSVSSVCAGNNFTIGVQQTSFGLGVSLQWQKSTDGQTWTDVAGQTGLVYSGSQTQATSYRLRATCLAGGNTAYSGIANVGIESPVYCYCTSTPYVAELGDITQVTFAGINNTTAADCDSYSDYSAITGVAVKGATYDISVKVGNCDESAIYQHKVSVFIDWNQNGTFTDPGEKVFDPAIIQAAVNVTYTGSVTIPATALSGITRMRVINDGQSEDIEPCGLYGSGETEDYMLNVVPAPTDGAAIWEITRPSVPACSLNQIWVKVQNLGTVPLTSAIFTVKVNGVNVLVAPWSGNIPVQGSAEVHIPSDYILADGDSIWVGISMPNGQAGNPLLSPVSAVSRRVYKGLSGIKRIGGTNPDYANTDAAITALRQRGVCDTVYFHIAPGVYVSQHVFTEYLGAGPGRLAVFESASGNPDDVVFSFNSTASTNNYVFLFDGGDGYMLRNLTARNTGNGFSGVIDIKNGANDLTFENNTLSGDTTVAYDTGDLNNIVVSSSAGTSDYRTVLKNNRIIGGNRGIVLAGTENGNETGHVVEGNTISRYAYMGTVASNLSGFVLRNNTFASRSVPDDLINVFISEPSNGVSLEGNKVLGNAQGYGILLANQQDTTGRISITNNFIYMGSNVGNSVGIDVEGFLADSLYILLANNSISINSNGGTASGISLESAARVDMFNNNVGAFGTAPALRVSDASAINRSNRNNWFGSNVAEYLGVSLTLDGLKAASGKDANSISVAPGFNGSDLHTCTPALNAAGMPLANIARDIDGESRSATPDIGADEFLGDAGELLLQSTFLKCPGVPVTIGNVPRVGITYSWTPSGSTSQITASAAGTYIITATSACGTFKDTAVVTDKPMPIAGFTHTVAVYTATFTNTSTNAASHLWNFGDGTTSTDLNPVHVYTTPGTYPVTLTVTGECGSVTFGPQPVNVTNAGIDEQTDVNVNLFPNPTDGTFTITLNGVTDAVTVNVVDVTGKAVLQKNVPAGVNQIGLDAASLASGMYSVKISAGSFTHVLRMIRK